MRRSSWTVLMVAVVLLVVSSPSAAGSTVDVPARVPVPADLGVEQEGRLVTLRWSAVEDARVAYYVVRLDGEGPDRELTVEAGPDPEVSVDDLPIWEWQRWSVSARQDHLVGSEPVDGEPFRPTAQVVLDEEGPLDEDEGTDYSQGEERKVWFRLDHRMPVDVWVEPYIVEQVTTGDDLSDDAVHRDQQFPTAPGDRVTLRAGDTRGFFVIRHWPDRWRRYVHAQTTFGLRSSTPGWDRDGREVGGVDVDGVRLEHVLHEDDEYRWPEVLGTTSNARVGRVARVPVRLRTPARRATTLRYRTVARSARPGRDFRSRRGSVTVARNARVAWVRVPVSDRRGAVRKVFAVRVVRADRQLAKVTTRSRTLVRIRR